jgi:hypothetical protein
VFVWVVSASVQGGKVVYASTIQSWAAKDGELVWKKETPSIPSQIVPTAGSILYACGNHRGEALSKEKGETVRCSDTLMRFHPTRAEAFGWLGQEPGVIDLAQGKNLWTSKLREAGRTTTSFAFDADTIYWVAPREDLLYAADWKTGQLIGEWNLPMYERENTHQYSHGLGISGPTQIWRRIVFVPSNIFGPDGKRESCWAIRLSMK